MPAVLPAPLPKELGPVDLQAAIDDYMEREKAAEIRHEFYYGVVTEMPGGTADHSLFAVNFAAVLHALLRGKNCRIFSSDLRVFIAPGAFYYPDVSIVRGEPEIDYENTLRNPVVLVEVLSKSTQKKDRTEKKNEYQRIETLQHYVMMEQNAPRIEHYERDASGNWPENPTVVEGLSSHLSLSALGVTVPLADIYEYASFA